MEKNKSYKEGELKKKTTNIDENIVEAKQTAEMDIENDPDLSKNDALNDLDEGELARAEAEKE